MFPDYTHVDVTALELGRRIGLFSKDVPGDNGLVLLQNNNVLFGFLSKTIYRLVEIGFLEQEGAKFRLNKNGYKKPHSSPSFADSPEGYDQEI
jgi:hypothetical protein